MSDYISINVQEIEPAQSVHHSARTKTVTYLVANPNTVTNYRHDLASLNENTNNIDNVADYFKERELEIKQDYKQHIKQSMKANTKLYQEAVISFGRERFEQNNQSDILKATEDFCLEFEKKYNVKILMSSLHLDEGHKDENGTIQHNYHTHLLIENYSFDTHKTGMRKVDFRTLQTELAQSFEHLGFVRGDPEKKAVRLEHREYRAMKEQESALQKEIESLKSELASVEQVKEQYKLERQNLKDSGTAKQSDYQELKKQYTDLEQLAKNDKLTITDLQDTLKKIYNQCPEKTAKTYTDIGEIALSHIQKQAKDIKYFVENESYWFNEIQAIRQENKQLKNELIITQSENQQLKSDLNALQSIKNTPDVQTYQPTPEKLSEAIKSVSKQQSLINWQTQTIETLKNHAEKSKFIKTHEIAEIDDSLDVQLKPLDRLIGAFTGVADFVEKILEKFTAMERTISQQANEITGLHNKIGEWEKYADHLEEQLNHNEQGNEWER